MPKRTMILQYLFGYQPYTKETPSLLESIVSDRFTKGIGGPIISDMSALIQEVERLCNNDGWRVVTMCPLTGAKYHDQNNATAWLGFTVGVLVTLERDT